MKIQELVIQTSNLDTQYDFYVNTMGIPVHEKTEHYFSLKIGYSTLIFHKRKSHTPYHIAFHIGSNTRDEALEWVKKKTSIIQFEGKDLVDFPAWNAESIYFYDQDKNVIEFICRKHFPKTSGEFSGKSLQGIAEIGVAVENPKESLLFLNRYFNMEVFKNNTDTFYPIGDENGLLITVDKNQKTWFPTNDKTQSANFDLKFTQNEKLFELYFEDGKLLAM